MPKPSDQSRLKPSSRAAALNILRAVLDSKRALDDALEQCPLLPRLDDRDRAFARLLAATVLRRLGQIDALIDHCLERPLPPKAKAVREVLRLGIAQLVFIETPAHAAVDTSVELARDLDLSAHVKLVNAVLRRMSREGRDLAAAQDSALLNTPGWLWQSWVAAYGEDSARAIAAQHLIEAPLDISVKGDAAHWAEILEADILPTGSLRRAAGGQVPALPGFDEGAWWVQDAAAALPARLLGDVAGQKVADLCAAPGGKTAQLCAAGAQVVALDRSAPRLERLSRNLARLKLSAETVIANAATWEPPEKLDAILLDAPCSATGTLRRHPDAAWLKSPLDVAKLAVTQTRLLDAALTMLKPGGKLVYCVCSMQPEEGPDRIAAVLEKNPEITLDPIAAHEIGGLAEALRPDGTLRTLPQHLAQKGGMDAFYGARLIRNS